MSRNQDNFNNALKEILGEKATLFHGDAKDEFDREWKGRSSGNSLAVALPNSVKQIQQIVALCASHNIGITPQGGRTGLVGGSITDNTKSQIILSLSKLNKIKEVNTTSDYITLESGVIVETAQEQALKHQRTFPISLGSQGSCQIGGIISTNAGGIHTIKYGNTREQVLGLEVILPNGEIWNGLNTLRKNNTGYDLKNLFIGAEGTLGVITAATLRLAQEEHFFFAIETPQKAVDIYNQIKSKLPGQIEAFEIIPRIAINFALSHIPETKDPFTNSYPWYLLVTLSATSLHQTFKEDLSPLIEEIFINDLAIDALQAQNLTQANQFWHLREAIVQAQPFEGGSIKHDVSVPIDRIPSFIEKADKLAQQLIPNCRPVAFGHLGDGNIHLDIAQPTTADTEAYMGQWDKMAAEIHNLAVQMGGSFSAEHGIGTYKREELSRLKDPTELHLMKQIKRSLDPKNIMNPNKIFSTKALQDPS